MVSEEPRVRRRGMFFHVETPELDHVEQEAPEGLSIRLRVARARLERRPAAAMSAPKAAHAVPVKSTSATGSHQQARMTR